mmetsp:Transcript_37768/g.80688  ORF Transcript_37768/g.80688 Transcript_37768/m.80688 type:complete len:184 (-) Transcript_37768:380-931(-)|eukprot:CAMPEP_0172553138 /NCGR_PEP_ID=MMETSP1067-20121228/48754_1 /TAXON_ID=265564 ORGANISM="Thalassiosira punctigera, Strain Tpunct2005C2" /NCGR_SAMPLE_ID=MMETSP1067 /ASSEMBLY_ACC=CAM_ASM_000444 /LENGTH=183 /DNA_ID=CAMNT_0013341255 /DNA_START=161 /DNA_END=712 /DNA_ORIENTATION=+
MAKSEALSLIMALTINPSAAFHVGASTYLNRCPNRSPLRALDGASTSPTESSLDPNVASQFTIQVCTSTSCSKKLSESGLDQYHVLGEIFALAQSANLEKCMIIEDGGCLGGKNCKMGPCVAISHEDFVGNVALEGMNSNEFQERVFHNVLTEEDAERVWNCMENAISLMAEEYTADGDGDKS